MQPLRDLSLRAAISARRGAPHAFKSASVHSVATIAAMYLQKNVSKGSFMHDEDRWLAKSRSLLDSRENV